MIRPGDGPKPLHERLLEERKRQRYSRPALAQKMGYAVSSLLAWESGKRAPGGDSLRDWLKALDVKITEAEFKKQLRPKKSKWDKTETAVKQAKRSEP